MTISTAIDQSAIARVVGIKTTYVNLSGAATVFLPMRIAVIGQGSTASTYSLDKVQVLSAQQAGSTFGFGSPIHLACLQLLPPNGDGVGTVPVTVYPLEDAATGVAATGTITPAGLPAVESGSYKVVINNIESESFVVVVADTVATLTAKMTTAINAVPEMPVIAVDGTTVVNLTSKWAGVSANDIYAEVTGDTVTGATFAIVQLSGGLVDPETAEVEDALAQVGNVWENLFLNCFNVSNTTIMDTLVTFAEGKWGALNHQPLMAFYGNSEATVATAIATPDSRKTDRTNCQLVAPGSNDLPLVIAARQLARIAPIANNNPPQDYAGQQATGLTPGLDSVQWDYLSRDTVVKGGSSTVEISDGVVEMSDTVTFYHPTGESNPPYRFVNDQIKVWNVIFNAHLIFAADEWKGAPLIPDDQPTANRTAKKPKHAKAAIAQMIDNLALDSILSDPKTAKESIQAGISTTNPRRLDIAFTVQIAGNTGIISIDFNWGFYFGTAQAVA